MNEKIEFHRKRRGPGWRTIEAPRDLRPALEAVAAHEVVLLDCATMWLSNHLLAESDLSQAEADLIDALENCAAPVVVVSGEVGLSVVPDNALARRFQIAQGRLNQTLAARADVVVNVIAGLPQILKGQCHEPFLLGAPRADTCQIHGRLVRSARRSRRQGAHRAAFGASARGRACHILRPCPGAHHRRCHRRAAHPAGR